MPTPQRKPNEEGVVERLSRRGEEALTKLMDEVGRNERVTEALGRASSAKGKLDGASRRALQQVGLAPADDLEDLRKQVERLEKRLAKLEGGSGGKATAKRSETKKPSTAKRRTTKAKTGAKAPSPPAGRALGGGAGRGSS
jgi:polyhydroxyalkanoate synthesis regulator phasin